MRWLNAALATLLLVAALAPTACEQAEDPLVAQPDANVGPVWVSCDVAQRDPSLADAIDLRHASSDFVPVGAVVCNSFGEKRADGGVDEVATESRADDIAELLATLRLPDEPLTSEVCTADAPGVPYWFALLDGEERWVSPGRFPTDTCGKIRFEVRDAVATLKLTEVSKRTVREIESAEAVAAGCSQRWTDMVWFETVTRHRWGTAGVDPFQAGRKIRLCIYRVPAREQGGEKRVGEFERGGILRSDLWASIERAVGMAGPPRSCSTPADRFALLKRADGLWGAIHVELDGCQRIMSEPLGGRPALAQGSAELIELLHGRD